MTFVLTVPLAILPFRVAGCVWTLLSASSFLLAAYLMFILGARWSSVLSGSLCGFLAAGSIWLLMIGNGAMLSIGFSMIAVYTFVEKRWEWGGVSLFAAGFAPQTAQCRTNLALFHAGRRGYIARERFRPLWLLQP